MRKKVNPSSWPTLHDLSMLLDVLNGRVIPRPDAFQRIRKPRGSSA
jgi:hypothetical protein